MTGNGEILAIPRLATRQDMFLCSCRTPFLAGDTSYTQDLLLAGKVDGVSPNEELARQTLRNIRELARQRPLIYLPSHDPESKLRLEKNIALQA